MRRSVVPTLVVVVLLFWSSSSSGSPPAVSPAALSHGDIPADHQGQPARPCQPAGERAVLTFTVEPDTPQPSCWKVRQFRALQVINATGDFGQPPQDISGSLRGVGRFRLKPGASVVLRLRPGREFAEGDHCVTVDAYPGSCLAIWVTRDAR